MMTLLENRLMLAAGDLDPSFGGGGNVFGPLGSVSDVAVQADGKVLVVGPGMDSDRWRMRRYTAAGALDSSFGGGDGAVETPIVAEAVEVQPDGKILLGGHNFTGILSSIAAVARLNADGSIDRTFGGGDGVAEIPAGNSISPSDFVRDIELAPGGKIVAVGVAVPVGEELRTAFMAARLNPDGSMDQTFSRDGVMTVRMPEGPVEALAADVHSDGKIVTGGSAQVRVGEVFAERGAVVRINQDGSLDGSFDGDGVLVIRTPGHSVVREVETQFGNRILVGEDGMISRLTATGAFDTTFGEDDGVIDSDGEVPWKVRDIEVMGDQRFLAAGQQIENLIFLNPSATVRRFLADGRLDTSFGGGDGIANFNWGVESIANALALDEDRVLVGGHRLGQGEQVALARLFNDGGGTTPPPPAGGNGLLGIYFDNENFTDARFQRTDASINFDWGQGSPDGRIEADAFSIRWSGQIEAPATGRYTFITRADDRAKLIIDGRTVVNYLPGQTSHTGAIDLSAGRHSIVYEYVERTGNARARLEWAGPGIAQQVVPTSRLFTGGSTPPPTPARGLSATYYDDDLLSDRVFTRIDPTIHFDWGLGSPDPRIDPDTFGVTWGGRIDVPAAGRYTFYLPADDRSILTIDGNELIFYPRRTGSSAPVDLTAGRHTVGITFQEFTRNARISFQWSGPGISRQVVPSSVLSPPDSN
jgi:uncharacterized delta-60 repeat protein